MINDCHIGRIPRTTITPTVNDSAIDSREDENVRNINGNG